MGILAAWLKSTIKSQLDVPIILVLATLTNYTMINQHWLAIKYALVVTNVNLFSFIEQFFSLTPRHTTRVSVT